MTSLHKKIRDLKVDSLHKVVDNGTHKYLFFTKLSTSPQGWQLCVTDGIALWRLDMDEEELNTYKDIVKIASIDAYLNKFRSSFVSGDIQISQSSNQVSVTLGSGASALDFDLHEAMAAEKKIDFQDVLFRLAESANNLDAKLTQANKTIESLQAEAGKGGNKVVSFFADQEREVVSKQKVRSRAAGMSVINPLSKKRKTAQGMVFDGNDNDSDD